MKNTFGTNVSVTLFGESHGNTIGAVLDGLAPGIRVDEDFIRFQLSLRRPAGHVSTGRVEPDAFQLVSGVKDGCTTGAPICVLIPNEKQNSADYESEEFLPRPGHADLTAFYKYHGFEDRRGGGHFSGRLTAPLVAVGAIAVFALRQKDVLIGTHLKRCAGIVDRVFMNELEDIETLNEKAFAVLDENACEKMIAAIEAAAEEGDSVGGVLETAVCGLPAGVGEPWFDSVESMLSHVLFSIPAVKGVEFGDGFLICDKKGSEANDGMRLNGDTLTFLSNHNGGVLGGITTGNTLKFCTAIKPTPSIFKEQYTVDLTKCENAALLLKGRHDPAIAHRARVVVDSVTALALCDLLSIRYGTDWLKGDV
ncbi:MAG: chorismate synthase [Clostridia bacterium]|nr:chorismate synthase [Clostridia bacterium]